MSAIASKWAYSRLIKSPVAKNILAFLASHNFPGNKTFFSLETISGATAYSRRSVISALQWLVQNEYLLKETRIDKNGSLVPNVYVLNIPNEYVEKFCEDYKLSTRVVQEVHQGSAGDTLPLVQEIHPNNKSFNLKSNKREKVPVDNPESSHSSISSRGKSLLSVESYKPSEQAQSMADLKGINPDLLLIKFVNKNQGSRMTQNQWEKRFISWIEKERTEEKQTSSNQPMFYGPGHPTWESLHNPSMHDPSRGVTMATE